MPYIEIAKQPVFLSTSRSEQLRHEALKEKTPRFRIASMIAGTKEKEEAEPLMFDALERKYLDNAERFRREWVEFDLVDDEARENVWDLLYDYCSFYGHAYLRDFREPFERLIDDMKYGDAYTYPMGRVFALDHYVRPGKWWWRYTHKMIGRTVRVVIITSIVTRLVGSLSNFTLFSPWLQIRCGEDLEILPVPALPHEETDLQVQM